MAIKESGQRKSRRLLHFTPLRYPGGKAKLAAYVKAILKKNLLLDGEYVEPYAGGAAIAMELLLHEYVSRIQINDISRPVYSFWKAVLNHTDELCKLVVKTPLNYVKARALYYDFYEHQDHETVAHFITQTPLRQRWIVSYDNVEAIRKLYRGVRYLTYDIGYSARSAARGSEIMFFCDNLEVPELVGPLKLTRNKAVIGQTA